jgi:hypothetical protein
MLIFRTALVIALIAIAAACSSSGAAKSSKSAKSSSSSTPTTRTGAADVIRFSTGTVNIDAPVETCTHTGHSLALDAKDPNSEINVETTNETARVAVSGIVEFEGTGSATLGSNGRLNIIGTGGAPGAASDAFTITGHVTGCTKQ